MSEISRLPHCYGDMRDGNVRAERCCNDCRDNVGCRSMTQDGRVGIPLEHEEGGAKKLDKEWVELTIDLILGPSLIILGMRSAKEATKLRKILADAIIGLYGDGSEWADSNAWVVATSDRLHDLYNTYMTAKLIHFFDNGVPVDSKIVTPGKTFHKMR